MASPRRASVTVKRGPRYLDELYLPPRRLRINDGRFVAQRSLENGR